MTSKPLLSIDQLADYLGVKKSWVYDRTYRGKIPCYKLGKLLRFDIDEIEVWLINQHVGPNTQITYPKPVDPIGIEQV